MRCLSRTLAQIRGLLPFPHETLEDLAVATAGNVPVAILARLDDFRGESRFTTWADDAYLERSITYPDAQIVKGYTAGVMAPRIAGFGLAHKTDELRALVAFIKSKPIRSKSPPHEGRDR